MPALVNDLAVGVAVPEAGGVMSDAPILVMCDELLLVVMSETIECDDEFYFGLQVGGELRMIEPQLSVNWRMVLC